MFDSAESDSIAWPAGAAKRPPATEVHPQVTLRDLRSRPKASAHVIVFANEKGGVGKSTLAFHCAIALCEAGGSVAVIDLDRRQQSLSTVLRNRDTTARCLRVDLPRPRHVVLEQQNGAQLSQEIARVGRGCNFIIVDCAGQDSAVARYAIAMADTLVTPLNSSFVDLDLLGKFDPVTMRLKEPGPFARLVRDLSEARQSHGMPPIDWIVMKNRVRSAERRQQIRVDNALAQLMPHLGFRLAGGLSERVVYRELFPFGLTHLDLKRLPGLTRLRARTEDEIARLLADLALPLAGIAQKPVARPMGAKMSQRSAEAFNASLHAHMQPTALAHAVPEPAV